MVDWKRKKDVEAIKAEVPGERKRSSAFFCFRRSEQVYFRKLKYTYGLVAEASRNGKLLSESDKKSARIQATKGEIRQDASCNPAGRTLGSTKSTNDH